MIDTLGESGNPSQWSSLLISRTVSSLPSDQMRSPDGESACVLTTLLTSFPILAILKSLANLQMFSNHTGYVQQSHGGFAKSMTSPSSQCFIQSTAYCTRYPVTSGRSGSLTIIAPRMCDSWHTLTRGHVVTYPCMPCTSTTSLQDLSAEIDGKVFRTYDKPSPSPPSSRFTTPSTESSTNVES